MLPEEIYKRRRNHNNTPESVLLIIANYVVAAIGIQLFAMCTQINKFFWVTLACLALYNYFTIKRNREEFDRARTWVYIGSLVGIVLMFFLFRLKATPC